MRKFINIVEAAMNGMPVEQISKVVHVGSMSAADKRKGSYEGAGLSVSLNPNAWRQIARGQVAGDSWILSKAGGRFLDYHAMDDSLKAKILAWGESQGYIERSVEYSVSYYDDEMDDEMTITFDNREEAEEEAESYGTEVEERHNAPKGTATLKDRTMGAHGALQALLPVWVEDCTDLDGVWWHDELDTSRYSAPRGVIVPSKIKEWSVEKSDEMDEDDL